MLVIYTHQLTPRVQYIFDLLLKDLSGLDFQITVDADYFQNYNGPKFSYSKSPLGGELFFQSVELLYQSDIHQQEIKITTWQGLAVFFQTNTSEPLPFDVFAASFFMVSRYEEYLPFPPDEHGRYSAKNSLAFKNKFLEQPIVNRYAIELKKILSQKFSELIFKETRFEFVSTIDIDNAYAYVGKGLYRTAGAISLSILKGDYENLKLRWNALTGKSDDPYDTYSYYFELQNEYQFKSIFFFLIGDFTRHDKNLPHRSKRFQALIKSITAKNDFGIHPSYSSNQNFNQLKKETERLKNIAGKPVLKSRQHFLKMQFPDTYRELIAAGITDDYTMGYADAAGFRAGICSSLHFFDLNKNEITGLKLHPLAVMDATLNNYMKLNIEDAKSMVKKLADEVKAVNGTFISLWHNETLSETGDWKNWRTVFEFTVQYATSL